MLAARLRWPPGMALAGCDNVEKVLAPGRTHCLALMSGDLWSLAVEAREAGDPKGSWEVMPEAWLLCW